MVFASLLGPFKGLWGGTNKKIYCRSKIPVVVIRNVGGIPGKPDIMVYGKI